MARVTIEDCWNPEGALSVKGSPDSVGSFIRSRFELVALAAERAKNINAGDAITVERDNDKNAVIALREIAMGHLNVATLRELVIKRLRKPSGIDQIEGSGENIDTSFEDIGGDEFAMYAESDIDFQDEVTLEDIDGDHIEDLNDSDEQRF